MSVPTLPWHVKEPYQGCDDKRMNYSIWDEDGNLVTEACAADDDEAREVCVAIVNAVNRTGPAECYTCGLPAVCFGSYEDELHPVFACDDCCGHGNEDGRCEPVTA